MIKELSIETVSTCNLKCIMCPREGFSEKYKINTVMTDDIFQKIVSHISSHDIKMVSICGTSEPLLDKELASRIKTIKDISPNTLVFFITNGLLLTPERSKEFHKSNLDAITISFDGASEDTYNSIRVGSDFNTVLENIVSFREINPEISLVATCVVLNTVFPEMEDYVKLFIKKNVKAINFSSMFSYCSESQKKLYLDKNLISQKVNELKMKYNDKIIITSTDDSFFCRCMDHALKRVYIGADGRVSPCDQLHYAIYRLDPNGVGNSNYFSLGSLKELELQELLNKQEYLDFLNTLKTSKTRPKLCNSCPGYMTNKEEDYIDHIEYLNDIIASLIRHHN